MSEPYWKWSACELAEAIARREVSAREVAEDVTGRMALENKRVNAVVDDMSAEALIQALEHDRRLGSKGPLGPLHGVPVTIKENVDQSGRATPNGVVGLKNHVATADSPVVANLLKAGAIVIGRTNTPEFSFRAFTDNPLHGPTLNPWDPTRTPGGSSGGAAVSTLMGFGPIAHGNDIGGSLRIPASACGLSTVKPSMGRIPAFLPSAEEERGFLASQMSTQGAIAREVRDVRLALSVMIGSDAHDPWHLPMALRQEPIGEPIKVALTRETYGMTVAPGVLNAVNRAAEMLADAGYAVEEVVTPSVMELAEQWLAMTFGEIKVMMDPAIRRLGSDAIQKLFDDYYALSHPVDPTAYIKGLAERTRLARQWSQFLAEYPLMLSPFQLNETNIVDADMSGVAGLGEVFQALIYSYGFNYIGLPAGVVCAGLDSRQLPVGVQVVGRRFREDLILDALQAIEDRFGVLARVFWEREDRLEHDAKSQR